MPRKNKNKNKLPGVIKTQAEFQLAQELKKLRVAASQKVASRDKKVSVPVAQSRVIVSHTPRMYSNGKNPVVYHRELIQTVSGAQNFTMNGGMGPAFLSLNPVNSNLFPWLLPVATSFEKYRFKRLRLSYVPLCSTAFVGRLGLFYDQDSQDVGPFTRQDFGSFKDSVDTPVWKEVSLDAPSDGKFKFLNDTGAVDRKLFDAGRFGWVVYSCGNGDVDGDLYLEYEIELETPQPSMGLTSSYFNPVGNALVLNTTGGPGFVNTYLFTQTATTFDFNYQLAPGTYYFVFNITGLQFTAATAITTGNATINGLLYTVTNGPNGNHTLLVGNITVHDITGKMLITETITNGGSFTQHQLTLSRTIPQTTVQFA